ncbi:MAG TPA: hypothetical protein VFE36_11450, partial [Candidatus Baltobacteraceae bacterium]|nr:hypothetical protein [Candidatus Baltobacteraceae bacterium]
MKRAILHVGTHKTGTTSIQSFLSSHAEELKRSGIYFPSGGKHSLGDGTQTSGHQRVPWGLIEGDDSALVDVLDECARADAPCIVISSEELELLHDRPQQVRRLRERLTDAGYDVTVVAYLREQPGYLESMYSEMMKRVRFMRFSEFLDGALRDGAVAVHPHYPVTLRYGTFIANWAAGFGPDAVVARPYDARSPAALIPDFLQTVAALSCHAEPVEGRQEPLQNRRMTLGQLVVQLHWFATQLRGAVADPIAAVNYAGTTQHDPILGEPFAALRYEDRVSILEQFSGENARAERAAGIRIPGTRLDDIPPRDDARWAIAARQRAIVDAVTDFWFAD